MRLFTAIDIAAEARAALVELLSQLKPLARFQWSRPEYLHITTKFIGAWPAENYESMVQALAGVPKPGPIEIAIGGLGWHPNPHSPRVLFAGIKAGPSLAELHKRTDAACSAIGVRAENQKFNPHLTLARIKSPDGLPAIRQRIAQLPSADFGRFTATAFHLYESITFPGGSQYSKLEEFPLL
ncbi:MAG: RNA 2',3'-cyclic phosphodiesterase [Bryobacteraceae bacterium]